MHELEMGNLIDGVTCLEHNRTLLAQIPVINYFYLPKKFSDQDLIRYQDLSVHYTNMGIQSPQYWMLYENNFPKFTMNYNDVIIAVRKKIDEFNKSPSPISTSRISILTFFSDYLSSIKKRCSVIDTVTGSYERPDGIESMFLSEFISWFCNKVPDSTTNIETTIEVFSKRLEYCKSLQISLSKTHWHNNNRSNFTQLLKDLSDGFSIYLTNLHNQKSMKSFNDHIDQLMTHTVLLINFTINILYSMINNTRGDFLQIQLFMTPSDAHKKLKDHASTGLGKWLRSSIEVAGINYVSLEPNMRKVTDYDVKNHLKYLHPNDEFNMQEETLNTSDSVGWGHWPFALTLKNDEPPNELKNVKKFNTVEEKASYYLTMARELHRQIIIFSFYYQNLTRLKLSNTSFGTLWTYGSAAGKAMISETIAAYEISLETHQSITKEFWMNYYTADAEVYLNDKKQTDAQNLCFAKLATLNAKILNLTTHTNENDKQNFYINIKKSLKTITEQAEKLPEMVAASQENQIQLYQHMLAIMNLNNRANTPNYQLIEKELQNLKNNNSNVTLSSNNTNSIIEANTTDWIWKEIIIEKNSLKLYTMCKTILTRTLPYRRFTLIDLPSNINPHLKKLYNTFVVSYYKEVITDYDNMIESSFIDPLSWGKCIHSYFNRPTRISWGKLPNFRWTYCKVLLSCNAIIEATQKTDATISELDMLLTLDEIKNEIKKNFEKNNYSTLLHFELPFCKVTQDENFLKIQIHSEFTNYLDSTVDIRMKELNEYILRISKEHIEFNEKITKMQQDEQKLKDTIDQKNNEKLELENDIEIKTKTLDEKIQEIAAKEKEITEKDKKLAENNMELSAKNNQITQQQKTIKNNQIIIQELRKTIEQLSRQNEPENNNNLTNKLTNFFGK